MLDVEQASVYNNSNRNFSYLDLHENEILTLLSDSNNISAIYRKLKEKGIKLTYSALKHSIAKTRKNNEGNHDTKNEVFIKVSRAEIIKYIFNWKHREETTNNIDDLIERYPIIKTYKIFYHRFKSYLIDLNILCFVNLLNSSHEDNCINKFILSLKSDWEAVLNAASCNISNGIAEGSVNKIKQIKRDMYGRASSNLLREKVIYQSLFY